MFLKDQPKHWYEENKKAVGGLLKSVNRGVVIAAVDEFLINNGLTVKVEDEYLGYENGQIRPLRIAQHGYSGNSFYQKGTEAYKDNNRRWTNCMRQAKVDVKLRSKRTLDGSPAGPAEIIVKDYDPRNQDTAASIASPVSLDQVIADQERLAQQKAEERGWSPQDKQAVMEIIDLVKKPIAIAAPKNKSK